MCVFFRCLFGALALIGWVWLRGGWQSLFSIERKLWPLVLVSGIDWLTLFEGFHRTSIGFATIIYHLQPFSIVLAGGLCQTDRNWLIGFGRANSCRVTGCQTSLRSHSAVATESIRSARAEKSGHVWPRGCRFRNAGCERYRECD
ncbi:hypothetical protein MESS4_20074 [Mesorhizobium sp. STM 4661]|nr:hypothetical protein MESS4_20074 [Mesorhizobium sp. STM 4661]